MGCITSYALVLLFPKRAHPMTRTVAYEDLPELLTVEEMAAYLKIGRSSAYGLVERREVPFVRYGRLIRIPKTALRAPVTPTR
jgi:excisionase family DNA binding protein